MHIVVYPIHCRNDRRRLSEELLRLERNVDIRWGDSLTKPTWMEGILNCDCVDALVVADGYLYWSPNSIRVCNHKSYNVDVEITEVSNIVEFIDEVNQRI